MAKPANLLGKENFRWGRSRVF